MRSGVGCLVMADLSEDRAKEIRELLRDDPDELVPFSRRERAEIRLMCRVWDTRWAAVCTGQSNRRRRSVLPYHGLRGPAMRRFERR